jgi:hypothetical protein
MPGGAGTVPFGRITQGLGRAAQVMELLAQACSALDALPPAAAGRHAGNPGYAGIRPDHADIY